MLVYLFFLCTNISCTSLQLLQPYFQQITLHLHLLSFQPYYRETVIIIIVYCISVYLLGRRLANLSFFCILEHWGLRCILHYCQRSARKCIKTYFVYFVMYAIFSVLIVSNLIHSLTQIRTMSPTFTPTLSPTMSPTLSPSLSPTLQPTLSP